MLTRVGSLLLVISLAGCAASVRSVVTSPGLRLRQYDPVFAVLRTASGNIGVTGGQVAGVIAGSLSEGDKQGALALESFRFELLAIGFHLVSDRQAASAIVEFSIGSIRYDPLAGWIADQALANFIDIRSGETLASFRAGGRAITPTVNRLVEAVSKAIRERY